MARQRLQRVLAAAGVDSRRKCEELILQGAVEVNGKVVDSLPAFVDPQSDVVSVEGRKIRTERKVYFLLNKPKGVICTNSDPQGRTKAVDLVRSRERIFCVGRLDVDTTGLIILTNDSNLTNLLTHPRYGVAKTYLARVKGRVDQKAIEQLKRGIWLAEGKTKSASVKALKRSSVESVIQIKISQGLNRQIRRMLARIGLPVKSLQRTGIANLTISGLGVGKYRSIGPVELRSLRKAFERANKP